jgi:hypothetical protein
VIAPLHHVTLTTCHDRPMALNIKNASVERLAGEVASLITAA